MHAYRRRDQSERRKSKSFLVSKDLPNLPSPGSGRAGRGQNVWLRRVAVSFLLISLALIIRSAWASSSVAGP